MSEGTYRLAINGFTCVSETWDDALNWDGQHDEVYFRVSTRVIDKNGTVLVSGEDSSMVMGDVRGFAGRLQVGSAQDWLGSRTGGVVSTDSYPSTTPHLRSVDLDQKEAADGRRFPPYTIWKGRLSDTDDKVAFVTPTIWEWDPGTGAVDGWIDWLKKTDQAFGQTAKDVFGKIWPASRPVFDAVSLGIQTFATLPGLWSPFGKSMHRPIGLQRDPNDPNGSTLNATTLALTYELAEYLVNANPWGLGNGGIPVAYQDDPFLRGYYIIYLQLEKTGGGLQFPDGSLVRETSRPEVYVVQGNGKFWIPNPAVLDRFGGWAAVRVVPDGALGAAGVTDVPRDGTLIRELDSPVVWRVQGAAKEWVVSPAVLANHGGWAAVRLVPNGAMAHFPQGPDLIT